jgi:crossover junction endodeoxyribonuclease RuvC
VVVGIDPGSIATGYGSIRRTAAGVECLGFGCIRPSQRRPFEARLEEIYDRLLKVIDAYKPDRIAVETIFHSKSARAALVMGHVRGVVLLAAAKAGVRVFEYTPLEEPQCGSGPLPRSRSSSDRKLLPCPGDCPGRPDALAIAQSKQTAREA